MADNIISQYYTKNDGSQIGDDDQLINGVYQNEKIINKNSGEKFVKSSNYRNVFDKVDETISKIEYDKAKRAFLCKNASGVEVDTFSYRVPVVNYGPTLEWDKLTEIGRVDGTSLMVRMPQNPTTIISSFHCSQFWYRKHSDGFIEMGGYTSCAVPPGETGSDVSTNFPIEFSNTYYTLLVQFTRGTGAGVRWGDDYMLPFTRKKTTKGFSVYSNHLVETGSEDGGYDWYACGF